MAKIGQYAENVYFGKASGLLDQVACSVGGFAGTIQTFVPAEKTEEYVETMDSLFGSGSCYIIRIRPAGGIQLI